MTDKIWSEQYTAKGKANVEAAAKKNAAEKAAQQSAASKAAQAKAAEMNPPNKHPVNRQHIRILVIKLLQAVVQLLIPVPQALPLRLPVPTAMVLAIPPRLGSKALNQVGMQMPRMGNIREPFS